jgi:chitinase
LTASTTTPPTLAIDDDTVWESTDGTVSARLMVRLSAASDKPVTVRFNTSDGTATAADYRTQSGTLTFPAGTMTQLVTVLVSGDRLMESSETFKVVLSAAEGATIGDAEGNVTITDNDAQPTLTVDDDTVTEGTDGTVYARVTIRLSDRASVPVTVAYATAGNSATGPGDFTRTTGTLTFPVGATTAMVLVPIVGDRQREATEKFRLVVSAPTNARIVDAEGVVTVMDDDQ